MRYAYYPGCSLHSTARNYDQSTREVCAALGIELEEIPDWICCGASSAHMTSRLLSVALPARNLITAREMGQDVMVCCAACYSRLRFANKAMGGDLADGTVENVDKILGEEYRGEVRVSHLLDILVSEYGLEALAERVVKRLEGLRIAAYYGCLLVRPPELVAFDDPENPTALDRLAAALGADPVAWSGKIDCCGASLSLARTDIVVKLTADIFEAAMAAGADCMMVACPLCQANLDMRQGQVNKRYKTDYELPIIYFTQLVGLALGLGYRELGIDKLLVSPQKVLEVVARISSSAAAVVGG